MPFRVCECNLTLLDIRELKHSRFSDADGKRKRTFSRARTVLSSRFVYFLSLMEKRYLVMWMWFCEGKLKVKINHFRLPSASQKRACFRFSTGRRASESIIPCVWSLSTVGYQLCPRKLVLIPIIRRTLSLSEKIDGNRQQEWNLVKEY